MQLEQQQSHRATVSDSGEVTALAAGNAVITAKVGDAEATCSVTVKAAGDSTAPDDNTTKPDNNTTTKVDVSKLVITATSEGGYTGELAATGRDGRIRDDRPSRARSGRWASRAPPPP